MIDSWVNQSRVWFAGLKIAMAFSVKGCWAGLAWGDQTLPQGAAGSVRGD